MSGASSGETMKRKWWRSSSHRSANAARGHVGLRIKQTGAGAVARDAIPLKVNDMLGERRRAELMSAMPDHPRLDHEPSYIVIEIVAARRQRNRLDSAARVRSTNSAIARSPAGSLSRTM